MKSTKQFRGIRGMAVKNVTAGCKNRFVYKMDRRYGRDTAVITKGKTAYELKDKDCP